MRLYEIRSSTIFVYHGTSKEHWKQTHNTSISTSLYCTTNIDTARSYALEWTDNDELSIIIRFSLQDLIRSPIKLDPNWENVEQEERLGKPIGKSKIVTWKDSLRNTGTFSVYGNIDSIKPLGTIIPVSDNS